jgi:hypothetical protein
MLIASFEACFSFHHLILEISLDFYFSVFLLYFLLLIVQAFPVESSGPISIQFPPPNAAIKATKDSDFFKARILELKRKVPCWNEDLED